MDRLLVPFPSTVALASEHELFKDVNLATYLLVLACTWLLLPKMAKIIPRIFRIMVARRRTLQGMARARSGQAPAWPLVSDRSVRRGSRIKRLRVYVHQALFTRARCPAVAVALEAGGADTYTQRAIPGSEPSQDFPRRAAEPYVRSLVEACQTL